MSPQEYGRTTGQHEGARQQADMWTRADEDACLAIADYYEQCAIDSVEIQSTKPARIEAFFGCQHSADEDWLRDWIEATFAHAERIQIETWSFPTEEPALTAEEQAEYWQDRAADQQYEESI